MCNQENFKCLQEHSSDLALIINQLGYEGVHNWLMIASGIKNVDFHWNRFDKTGTKEWCSPSYEYDVAKSKISQLYVYELTIFNYVWGAFENLLSNSYSKNQIKKIGKVNLCIKTLETFEQLPILEYPVIKNTFFEFFEVAMNNKLMNYNKKLPKEEIKVIYDIRNKFAHGEIEFPEDVDYNYGFIDPNDLIKLISISTRVVICHIQSLILIFSKGETVYSFLDNLFQNIDIEDYGYDLFTSDFILRRLHLKEISKLDLNIKE